MLPPGSARKKSDPSKQRHLADTIEDRGLSALCPWILCHLLKEVRKRRRHGQRRATVASILYRDGDIGFFTNSGIASVQPASA
ncbi:hypothetical protein [Paraburkholderia kirstenboschensis]|uniref:hypothetical protein n=1 Tax=Paraburkholderia kirstenboschensis TaxID=1245436 RepID=UPI0013E2B4A9|nr:hypothetical protein [Paraburkholderia kirstenboschensis]